MYCVYDQWWLSKKIQGANSLKLPNILEETLALDKYMGIYVDYTCYKKVETQAKSDFLITKSFIWLDF